MHGFAVAHDLGKGFASDGRENKVAVVDLATLQVQSRVDTGENPDGILYVPDFKEVYAFNGRGHSATVIDAATGEVVATIPLPGKPEFAVYDPGAKRIYNNIEDQNEIVAIDPTAHEVVATWPIAPGEAASGLAIDLEHHRLFAVCDNGIMVMVNSQTGEVVDTVAIGEGPDAARFDPATQLAFSSNGGDGTVTIVHEDSPSAAHRRPDPADGAVGADDDARPDHAPDLPVRGGLRGNAAGRLHGAAPAPSDDSGLLQGARVRERHIEETAPSGAVPGEAGRRWA